MILTYSLICLALFFIIKNLKIRTSNEKKSETVIFSSVIIGIAARIIMLILYLYIFFTALTMDQLIFTLAMPNKGSSISTVLALIVLVILIPSAIAFFNFILFTKRKKIFLHIYKFYIPILPFSFKHCKSILSLLILSAVLFSVFKLDLIHFIKYNLKPDATFYQEKYIDPKNVIFSFPQKKKNLILIYLESVEAEAYKYAKRNTNIIPELTKIANENISFSHNSNLGGAKQLFGTGFSIAAICCTQLGLPLTIPIGGDRYENTVHFFNGAYGLGDLLKDNGYRLSFMMGADSEFGGMNTLLKTHGNFDIKSLEYFRRVGKVPPNYFVWWGIEDKKIVEFAKEELLELSNKDKPFFFSVFLEDTHTLGGYACKDCKKKYPIQIHNVFSCMSKRVDNFLNWMKQQDFYEDSVIIIIGDHLYMGADLYPPKFPERHAYNAFINVEKNSENTKNRNFAPFDYFPTIVESMNIEFDADGLGLGRSLFSGKPTLLEELGEEKLTQAIMSKSSFYRYQLLNKAE